MMMKDKNYPCEGKLRNKIDEFYKLCDRFELIYPDIEESRNDFEFTSPSVVKLTEDADIPHVFGHFLCEYHYIEPDVVADIVKKLVINHNEPQTVLEKTKLQFEEEINHNMGLYR